MRFIVNLFRTFVSHFFHQVLGIPSILEFWRTLFMTVPDALMVMLETKLRVKNIVPQVSKCVYVSERMCVYCFCSCTDERNCICVCDVWDTIVLSVLMPNTSQKRRQVIDSSIT